MLLAIWTVLFVSFSSAITLPNSWFTAYSLNSAWIYEYNRDSLTISSDTTVTFSSDFDFYCFRNSWMCVSAWCSVSVNWTYIWQVLNNLFCVYNSDTVYFNGNFWTVYFFAFKVWDWVIKFPSSLSCQTEYNLIPIEEVDQSYCESNNLCKVADSSDCPNVWVSNLFINDIFHPWAFNVIMNIPSEIDWDYAYTNSWNNINIDVVWYNQDEEYINAWIDTNNYKPTTSDFTNIFYGFSKFGGLLIATLFVIFVFYLVKKVF